MPGAGYKTFTAGSVLTASDVNTYLMQQAVMVFTTEAARDAAITAPSEGMVAYLTAPTVPAATGDTFTLPTGVRTVYNGSVWVCVTDLGSFTNATGTLTSTTYTATLAGSPGANPSVTLVTGTTAVVSYGVVQTTGTVGNVVYTSIAVSGATTLAASDTNSVQHDQDSANYNYTDSTTFMLTGLTAGTNTFTLNYKTSGGTMTVQRRRLVVRGVA